jgi:hypothetical protein
VHFPERRESIVRFLLEAPHDDLAQSRRRVGTQVFEVDPRSASAFNDRISAAPELLRALAAPVGALMRDRVA